MSNDEKELILFSMPPSWFVKATRNYRTWCSITECPNCGLRGKYEDLHTVNPCPRCGIKPKKKVGRWVQLRPWWKCWGPEGYWKILQEDTIHFRPSNEDVSACGIERPEYSAYDGRDVDCAMCRNTEEWKTYTDE